ncbi:hypothetical protein Achl_3997 (plasmid) [Pseudarthrobacter chlorophenolicus A6]|uniref:Uncharacterized protein n=1 Tax=Pseudarthrobacter chlorophenolicus (strain ATCC 700700 / DSM 12829 / CIP 107037 / JCM 12360 / KCTC 9906 / NCIMB 13794 / A6) TaxID=452863 RepID=B8HHQ1_PSECP|nr:hypothetical protein [Pseudarthrobacter chlorophenolicus]ACL41948.1 hypothetical protein Achl_3997 [Pseudarthrobacter chlorophenolicus A6]SDQ19298.1 hypothetical protein SAMN04489738_0648 [Pseudarthrobacter chlorophenolicus]
MITHLVPQGKGTRPACGVDRAFGSDITSLKNYVTCNKCRGTKLFLEAESGLEPVHTSALHYLGIALRANEASIQEAVEENKEIDDPGEWERLAEERDQLLISIATLKALQSVELMVQK